MTTKRIISAFFTFCFLISCETNETTYIYDKNDSEYTKLKEYQTSQCKKSEIMEEMRKSLNFQSYGYEAEKIYKVTHKIGDSEIADKTSYIKITSVTDRALEYIHRMPDNNKSRLITFDTGVGEEIITAISNGACEEKTSEKYLLKQASQKSFELIDERIEGDDKAYTKHSQTSRIELKFPLVFLLYNYDLTAATKESGGSEKKTVYKFSISELSSADCDKEAKCDFELPNSYGTGSIVVSKNAHADNSLDSLPVSASYFDLK